MKKFSFSLQPILKVKRIHEKQKKAELAGINEHLRSLYDKKAELERQFEDLTGRFLNEMDKGIPVSQMDWHSNFAEFLRTQQKNLDVSISQAEHRKSLKQSEMVALLKEIKTIEKLRETQYKEYLEQIAKEEEKELGDLISYKKSVEVSE